MKKEARERRKIFLKRNKIFIFLTFGFLIFLFVLIGYGFITEGKAERPWNISVILYGNDSERWMNLKQGAEQAEKDYNVILNYVTTSKENVPEEQIGLIEREIENGADGLLIAASDSTRLEETIAELVQKIPIIMIETGVNNVETFQYLTADNYKMGEELANTIMKDSKTNKNVAIMTKNLQRDSINNRYEGFLCTLKGHSVITFNDAQNTPESIESFKTFIQDNNIDTVVALDNSSLENLVDVIQATNYNVSVYGIGNTDKIVYYLDKGVINSIIFQNEFSIGYLGTELIYKKLSDLSTGNVPEIAYQVINKDIMYTQENQRLLFPLVQ